MNKNISLLEEYLPSGMAEDVWSRVEKDNVRFRIAKPRKTKLGDYRPPYGKHGHRISVNADLNPYSFLITVLHEFAHLETWKKFKRTTKPHGNEWKMAFQEILQPYVQRSIFPLEVTEALNQYLVNPSASSCVDISLMRALGAYDKIPQVFVENLDAGAHFKLANGLVFIRGEKLRKRYRCKCITNEKWYFVSATANAIPIPVQQRLF